MGNITLHLSGTQLQVSDQFKLYVFIEAESVGSAVSTGGGLRVHGNVTDTDSTSSLMMHHH